MALWVFFVLCARHLGMGGLLACNKPEPLFSCVVGSYFLAEARPIASLVPASSSCVLQVLDAQLEEV